MAELEAATLVAGEGRGPVLALAVGLSFWGGLDPATGTIIDRFHPALGASVTGTILVMPSGRGSSSASAVLAEALRRGTGPAGILLAEPDPIVAVGAIVARRLYGISCPVVAGAAAFAEAAAARTVAILARAGEPARVLVGEG